MASQSSGTTYRWADRLVVRIVPNSKVRVIEGLLACYPLRRIEIQQLGEQVKRQRVGAGEQRGERYARLDWQRTNVILGLKHRQRPKNNSYASEASEG